jgi:hypothetical protein
MLQICTSFGKLTVCSRVLTTNKERAQTKLLMVVDKMKISQNIEIWDSLALSINNVEHENHFLKGSVSTVLIFTLINHYQNYHGPALPAHGSLDLKQEIQIQIKIITSAT